MKYRIRIRGEARWITQVHGTDADTYTQAADAQVFDTDNDELVDEIVGHLNTLSDDELIVEPVPHPDDSWPNESVDVSYRLLAAAFSTELLLADYPCDEPAALFPAVEHAVQELLAAAEAAALLPVSISGLLRRVNALQQDYTAQRLEIRRLQTTPEWSPHSHWDNHPAFPTEDWKNEVISGDTRLSYLDWVNAQLAAAQTA